MTGGWGLGEGSHRLVPGPRAGDEEETIAAEDGNPETEERAGTPQSRTRLRVRLVRIYRFFTLTGSFSVAPHFIDGETEACSGCPTCWRQGQAGVKCPGSRLPHTPGSRPTEHLVAHVLRAVGLPRLSFERVKIKLKS